MLDGARDGARDGGTERERPTLRLQVFRTLQAEIEAGQPPVGGLLPGEHELCARFGVSRHTMREALRDLAALGLVDRRQGSGTRVLSPTPRARFVQSMRTLDELRQYAADTRHVVRKVAMSAALSPPEAEAVGAARGARWVRIEGVRMDRAEAIAATVVLVHPRFAPMLSDVREQALAGTIYGLVEARSGERIVGAEQDIAAQPLPPGPARALGQREGDPALLFIRRYLGADGQPMVCSFNWHRADRFTYRMRLRRDD